MDNLTTDDIAISDHDLLLELQKKLKVLEDKINKLSEGSKPTEKSPEKQIYDESKPLTNFEYFIHIIGLIIFKLVTLIHFIHAFTGKLFVRYALKDININKKCIGFGVMQISFWYISIPSAINCFLLFSSFKFYDKIQSWMIAYWIWALFISIYWIINGLGIICIFRLGLRQRIRKINSILWLIVGINLPKEKRKEKGYLSIILASLIPAAIAGYIANFILEEKFILDCDQSDSSLYGDEKTVCTLSGECCEIVSSHNLLFHSSKAASYGCSL